MKNCLMLLLEKLLLQKRNIIEIVTDQLKKISQIEHSHPHSPANFFSNIFAGLIADMRQAKNQRLIGQIAKKKLY